MRLLTLASTAILLAAATATIAPSLAADVVGADTIVRSLRGVKHLSAAPATTPATPAPVTPAPATAAAPPASPPEAQPAVSLPVLFATGSAELSGTGREQLDRLGAALKDPQLAAAHFRIEGHTDTAGGDADNQVLSERRAYAVVDYLISRYGVARAQLTAAGMGKQGLAVPTGDQVAEPRNRRVVVINLDG